MNPEMKTNSEYKWHLVPSRHMDVDLQVKESHCKISNRKVTILDISEGSHKLLYNGNGMKLKAGELFRRFLFPLLSFAVVQLTAE